MVKVVLHLGWLVAFLVAVSIARPVHPRVYSPHQYELILPAGGTAAPTGDQALADDGAVRSERSTNLSHITGTARKIQMVIKNRYLQILPDGTVNGTNNDGSDYTILQRQSVKTGQLLVQSVATCLFLCMDSCGLLYGARNFTWDCVFNETFVQHRYITYSSSKYSNERRTLYMALNRRGQSRKVQVQRKAPLGKLSSYAMVLPLSVSDERVKDLAERILRAREYLQKDSKLPSDDFASIVLAQHPLRHHGYHHLCPPLHFNLLQNPQQEDGTDEAGRDKFRCRKRKKRKKKKRKCKEGEQEGDQCQNTGVKRKKKCQQGEGEEECQKRLEAAKRRRKSRNGDSKVRDDKKKNNNKKKPKLVKNKKKLVCDGEISIDTECVTNRTVRLDENQRDVDKLNELTMTPQSSSHVPQQPTSSPSSTTISTLTTSAISVTTTTSTTPISSSSSSTTVPATSLSTTETHAVAVTPSSSRIPIMSLTSSMTTKSASAVAARTSSSSSTKSEHASQLSSSAGDTTRIGTAK